MIYEPISKGKSFYAIGLNYKKADADKRGRFSVQRNQIDFLLKDAKDQGVSSILVNSTCNRTEIYGFVSDARTLIALLCNHSEGTRKEFEDIGYVFKNAQAVDHIFNVGTGLDSQILGDFEIIAQLKKSFYRSKKMKLTNPFMERLVNSVIQASKRIKNETEISSGVTSVSFASVRYILDNVEDVPSKNILLFGMGKIGRNTCENLVKHTENKHITLINRTRKNAENIAGKFHLQVKDFADLTAEIHTTDILIVATGAANPTITKDLIHTNKPLLILDLSIPKNVDENVLEHDQISLVHLDHLSKITDQTLHRRKQYIPQAQEIIQEVRSEFDQWLTTRKFVPTIKALKNKLIRIQDNEIASQRKKIKNFDEEQVLLVSNHLIQKITNQVANHLKDHDESNDRLTMIQEVFKLNPDE
ncbi:MAG: glutamyl-tRNA reductase [Flavobacteriaceae bacterium]|mgnify:CR=1 FL=1|jgi:glutamyl-tRNA reductase|nr:glutamyl-tRNA reductase [Flavobacteriaceae bacterium]MDG2314617.1 glutamyl-tRNA reductase [Flavobacteriaceae bacterium]